MARDPDAIDAARRLQRELTGASMPPLASYREPEILDRLVSDLERGVAARHLVFVREPAPVVRTRVPVAAPIGPAPLPSTPPPSKELSSFTVVLVDKVGDPLDGVALTFSLGGRREQRTTDGTGTARLEDVPESFATVSFADEASVRQKLRDRWQAARGREWLDPPADMTNTVVVVRRRDALPSTSVVAAEPHRIVLQPRVVLAQFFGMWFETSKCFLLPTAMEGVRFIRSLYDSNPETDLLVVGHTDTAGDPGYNDPLSLERSKSEAAYLTDSVDKWLAWYDAAKPDAKRWGGREDAMMTEVSRFMPPRTERARATVSTPLPPSPGSAS